MTTVVVPRRSDPWRDTLWDHVRGTWAAGFEVREGLDEGRHPFNVAAARNRGATGDWDVILFADADTIVPTSQARAAAHLASSSGHMVLAFERFVSVQRAATRAVLDGADPATAPARWTMPNAVSSCFAVPRSLWDEVGGFDERFEGWGFEDRAFYLACRARTGRVPRIPGDVFHLWHPRSHEKNPNLPLYQANEALAQRYRAAARAGWPAMRDLLEERWPARCS